MYRNAFLFAAALTFLVGVAPARSNWAWMGGSAVLEFTDRDWEILKAEARRVLDEVDSGVRVDWRNEESGNSGAIKALMTFTHEGMTCRRLAFLNLSKKGVRGVSNYNLCRQDDGGWAFLSDSEIRG
ncbi:MAG: RT0821/Lpp0805 family surface protein [Pseudomonadales bacterium]|jgi:surface antigen|nr:RT0821/Lpp0805 family surface protein [Pseudomonadales bacterium]